MLVVTNAEDSQGKLVCCVRMDKEIALQLVENILHQVNAKWNGQSVAFAADEEADAFEVVVE